MTSQMVAHGRKIIAHTLGCQRKTRRIIPLFGNQGGGVVTALLKNKDFEVRAVTRNVTSDKSKALEIKCVKVVEGDLEDPKSLLSVLSGCHGVFGVTNYGNQWDSDKEFKQGKNLVDACKVVGVKHLIYSGFEDITGKTGTRCPLTDGKVEIEKYMFASEVPSTSVRYPYYSDNFIAAVKLYTNKDENGIFVIGLPFEGTPIVLGSLATVGNAVVAIFASPEAHIGKEVGLCEERKTIQECADILSKHLAPKMFRAGDVTVEQYSKSGARGAEYIKGVFMFFQRDDLNYDLELTKKLDPSAESFEDWVKRNKDALNAVYQ